MAATYKQKKFFERDVKKLTYGIIHSQVGFADGVSIVINQVEEVMINHLAIPKKQIHYLTGKAKHVSHRITQKEVLWHRSPTNQTIQRHFQTGFGGALSEKIESQIALAKQEIQTFVKNKKIDVLIVHNSSHPVNFISSIALARFYRDQQTQKKKVPKYILWWHDSHLERERFMNPPRDVNNYLLEGVPGRNVEYIVFINKQQFHTAQNYFLELDKRSPGLYNQMITRHGVIYNTATMCINTVEDLNKAQYTERVETFMKEFGISTLLKQNRLKLDDVQFCLQHTRIVPRKRIDFALEWSYALFSRLQKKNMAKAFLFFISGNHGDESGNHKRDLIRLHKKLSQQYKTNKFFLVFAEDFKKATISFEETPIILRKLGSIGTYFSEIEGFGNNLLEILAAGIIPVLYTYPVFVSDIAKYKFKVVCLDKFEVTEKSLKEMMQVIRNTRIKKEWGNKNINILKKNFSHELIAPKLERAITSKRHTPKIAPNPYRQIVL